MFACTIVEVDFLFRRVWEIFCPDETEPRTIARRSVQQVVAGRLVDAALGQLCQDMVGVSLFVERLLENPDRIVIAERFGIAAFLAGAGASFIFLGAEFVGIA